MFLTTVYRASFRQTYAEMKAPTGEWKSVLAITIGGIVVTGWFLMFMKKYGLLSFKVVIYKKSYSLMQDFPPYIKQG